MPYGYGTARLSYIDFITGFAFELVYAAWVIVLGFLLKLLGKELPVNQFTQRNTPLGLYIRTNKSLANGFQSVSVPKCTNFTLKSGYTSDELIWTPGFCTHINDGIYFSTLCKFICL
jgi:hypothetical protein